MCAYTYIYILVQQYHISKQYHVPQYLQYVTRWQGCSPLCSNYILYNSFCLYYISICVSFLQLTISFYCNHSTLNRSHSYIHIVCYLHIYMSIYISIHIKNNFVATITQFLLYFTGITKWLSMTLLHLYSFLALFHFFFFSIGQCHILTTLQNAKITILDNSVFSNLTQCLELVLRFTIYIVMT
jgi:hypothetical protein